MPRSILTSEDEEGVPGGVASVTSAHYPVILVMVNGTRLLQLGGELTVLFSMSIHLPLPAITTHVVLFAGTFLCNDIRMWLVEQDTDTCCQYEHIQIHHLSIKSPDSNKLFNFGVGVNFHYMQQKFNDVK